MKKWIWVFCIILFVSFSVYASAKPDLVYAGQYYPEEFLLQGYDFFSKTGVNVQHFIFSSGTENNIALISGNADINVGSDSKTVALFGAIPNDAVIIGVSQRGNRYSTMVRVDSPYTDWADLKGKTVATRFGSGAEFVLRKYFDSRDDLRWEDFRWVNLHTEDMIATLASRQIEAFTVWAPTGEIAEAQGLARLLRNFGDVALTPVFMHTTKRAIETKRDAIVRFLAAHLLKVEMIQHNPEQAAIYASRTAEKMGMSVDPQAFVLIFERIDFSLDLNPTLEEELIQTATFLHAQGEIRAIPSFTFDTTLLQEAKEFLNTLE